MPTYEYRCSDCGHQFEIHQGIGDDSLTACERCGGRLRKVFHPAGIVFKGSGFYATDSRSKKSGSKDGTDSKKQETKPDSSSSDSGSSSKSGDGDRKKDGKKEAASSGKSDSKGDSKTSSSSESSS